MELDQFILQEVKIISREISNTLICLVKKPCSQKGLSKFQHLLQRPLQHALKVSLKHSVIKPQPLQGPKHHVETSSFKMKTLLLIMELSRQLITEDCKAVQVLYQGDLVLLQEYLKINMPMVMHQEEIEVKKMDRVFQEPKKLTIAVKGSEEQVLA